VCVWIDISMLVNKTSMSWMLFPCKNLMIIIMLYELLGELFGALKGRLYDSNKNLVMATLTTIGAVASAMGPTVEKSSKVCANAINDLLSVYMYVVFENYEA
jgi:hypothetical protein